MCIQVKYIYPDACQCDFLDVSNRKTKREELNTAGQDMNEFLYQI